MGAHSTYYVLEKCFFENGATVNVQAQSYERTLSDLSVYE